MTCPETKLKHENWSNSNHSDSSLLHCETTQSGLDVKLHTLQILEGCLEKKLRERKRNIELRGKLSKIAGGSFFGYDNSSMQNAKFYQPTFLKYQQKYHKLLISDQDNYIIRSMRNISRNHYYENDNCEWNGDLKIEIGYPGEIGYHSGDRNTCRLKHPKGFDWDMNDNMYICNSSCICKLDNKSNQVSLVAGHETSFGYNDGNNDEARFYWPSAIVHHQQNDDQSLPVLYVCDHWNSCIRMIDVTNGKTITFAGKGQEYDDVDGTLQSARFYYPWDIVKDDQNDDILYVSDGDNHKIKMIDMKKGMVSTLVGNKNDKSILKNPMQMQMIDSFIYVTCFGFKDCIARIDKHSKQLTKIKFNDGKKVSSNMYGITYHELDQCFYLSDASSIYKLQ